MRKNTLIKCLAFSALVATVVTSASVLGTLAKKSSDIQTDIIKPLSHIRGEEVNTLPENIRELENIDIFDPEEVFKLYNASKDMSSSNWKLINVSDYAKKYFKTGTSSVSAKLGEKTISIPVKFTDTGDSDTKIDVCLSVSGNYKTCYFVGEQFNKTNLSINVHSYNKRLSNKFFVTEVPIANVSFDTTTLKSGQKVVKATYNGLSVDIPVSVGESKSPTDVIGYTINGNYKTLYKNYDCFDRTGLIVNAHLANNEVCEVTSQLTWPSDEFDSIKAERSAAQTSLLEKWDDFHQINNVLKWEVKAGTEVSSYDVTVSLNPELTKVLYKANVTEPMYKMDDLYTGYDYYWQVKVNKVGGEYTKSPIYNFKTAKTPRTVYIQGISNTRDIGGSETPFGLMKEGYVYRGARVDEVSAAGLEVFKNKLGIQTDLDLRTPNTEVGRNNPLELPYYVGPIDMGMYQNYDPVINPGAEDRGDKLRKLRNALEPFLHEENYPIYFHCSVGRDRTGTVGAIIDGLMGVDQNEILRKYLISVFSVSGHYDLDNYKAGILNGVALLTMINRHSGNTTYEKVESLVKEAGLTDAQIQKIRDILTGKTNAKNSMKFIENDDNYSGQIVVNFKQEGDDDCMVFANPGSVVVSPITLKEGYAWFNGDEIVDLSKPINESMYLVSKRVDTYKVTIHYVQGQKADQIINARKGSIIQISDFAINGIIPSAFLDTGKEISRYTVNRDATINLMFK